MLRNGAMGSTCDADAVVTEDPGLTWMTSAGDPLASGL
jgi:hypothetical protein